MLHEDLGRGRQTAIGGRSARSSMDERRAVFGSTDSYIETVTTGQWVLVCRKRGVCIRCPDAPPNARPPKSVTCGGPASESEHRDESGRAPGFRWQA